jgi:hypothetical protein
MKCSKAFLVTALFLCVISFFNAGCNNSGDSGVVGLTGQGNGTDVPFTPTSTATKNGYSEIEWAQDLTMRLKPGQVGATYLVVGAGPAPTRVFSGREGFYFFK